MGEGPGSGLSVLLPPGVACRYPGKLAQPSLHRAGGVGADHDRRGHSLILSLSLEHSSQLSSTGSSCSWLTSPLGASPLAPQCAIRPEAGACLPQATPGPGPASFAWPSVSETLSLLLMFLKCMASPEKLGDGIMLALHSQIPAVAGLCHSCVLGRGRGLC